MLHRKDIQGNTPTSQNRVLLTLNAVLPAFNKLNQFILTRIFPLLSKSCLHTNVCPKLNLLCWLVNTLSIDAKNN